MEISFDGQSAGRIEFELFCGWAEVVALENSWPLRYWDFMGFHGVLWDTMDII